MYQATYFMPGASLHFFLMFAPRLVGANPLGALFGILLGPVLVMCLTKSLNEQPAVWCFFTMYYCTALSLKAFYDMKKINSKNRGCDGRVSAAETLLLIHKGTFGEAPMVYKLVDNTTTKDYSNGFDKAERVQGTNGFCEEKKED
jgi:hypothetical protein